MPKDGDACNCMVAWDPVNECHIWINGSFDGACGHPPSRSPHQTSIPTTHVGGCNDLCDNDSHYLLGDPPMALCAACGGDQNVCGHTQPY